MNKPWFEPGKAGNIVLNLPFDDGSWMKIVLGPWIPDFPAWLVGDNPHKAMCARFYISAIEGCPPSRSDYYAYREKRWQEMTEEMNNRD